MKSFNSPRWIGIFYILIIFIFGVIYWKFQGFSQEQLSFIDSIYFSVVTITTLGYGDITPKNDITKVLTALEAFSGIVIIGIFLNSVAQNYSEKQNKLLKEKEDEKWRPARLIVARNLCKFHQTLFNSLHYIVQHDYHADLKSHGFPKGFSQRDADAWQNSVFMKPLNLYYEELKKLIEYNNVALDSNIHPKVASYIVHAKEIINICSFITKAYSDKNNTEWFGSFNYFGITEMEIVYLEMLKMFPEISQLEKPNTTILSAKEILDLVKSSNENLTFLELRILD